VWMVAVVRVAGEMVPGVMEAVGTAVAAQAVEVVEKGEAASADQPRRHAMTHRAPLQNENRAWD